MAANLSYMVPRGGKEGQFFLFDEGQRLTRERFVAEVRKALAVVGIDSSRYAGQFLNRGSNDRCPERNRRLSHQDIGQVGELGECGVHSVHPDTTWHPLWSGVLSGH